MQFQIHSYIHHCQEESRGVKNHLNFTSKNCKVKIHDLLCWAMILHGFATASAVRSSFFAQAISSFLAPPAAPSMNVFH